MGWSYSDGPATRDVIKREFQHGWKNAAGDRIEVTDATWGPWGKTLWGILRRNDKPVCIVLWLVRQTKSEWGYKDMDESMGPAEVCCPLKLLDLCPEPEDSNDWSREWREKVRAYHAANRALNHLTFEQGDYVRFKPSLRAGGVAIGGDIGRVRIGPKRLGGRFAVDVNYLRINALPRHIAENLGKDYNGGRES